MMCARRVKAPLKPVPYDVELIPKAARDWKVLSYKEWTTARSGRRIYPSS